MSFRFIFLYFLIVAILLLVKVKAVRYEFVFDNDQIFDKCPDISDNNGIHDLFDLSQVTLEYTGSSVRAMGNLTCVWEGVQPKDRIEARAEVYKFARGFWQPTPYTVHINNFCKGLFDEDSFFYQWWFKYVLENDRKCLNNYGHLYRHEPFVVNIAPDFVVNMEGRHKIVMYLSAFDELNIKRRKIICFQMVGEFFRV